MKKGSKAKLLFECVICDKKLSTLAHMKNHESIHYENSIADMTKCTLCDFSFAHKGALKKHILEVHEEKKDYECPQCSKRFARGYQLKKHLELVNEKIQAHLKCFTCGKAFCLEKDLNKHINDFHPQEILRCGSCDVVFTREPSLVRHFLVVHEGKKPYSCKDCNATFAQTQSLKHHINAKHTKEKILFPCRHCNRQPFTRKDRQTKHEKMCPKMFKCSICGQTFRQTQTLEKHKKTHSGEKPFKCDSCDKQFTRSENFKIHVRNEVCVNHLNKKSPKVTSEPSKLLKEKDVKIA